MRSNDNVMAIVACLLWSTAFVGVKIALLYMSPLTLGGIRFMLAGMMLLPFCGGIRTLAVTLTEHRRTVLLVSLFQTFLLYGLFFMAMNVVPGAAAAIIIGASPVVSALVAHVMMSDDRMTFRSTSAILLGTAGIVLIALSSKPWEPVGLLELGGMSMLLTGSILSAVGNVIVARTSRTVHPVALNSAQMFIGGFLLLLVGICKEGVPHLRLSPLFYLTLAWLAFLSAAAFTIWFRLLGRVKVSRLNIWKFLVPVFGAISSWILLPNESPTPIAVAGLILVAVGVLSAGRNPGSGR